MLASYQNNPEIVQVLIESGANVNLKDKSSRTVLLKASWRCQIDSVRLLLAAKAVVNAVMADGRNAVQMAYDGTSAQCSTDLKAVIKLLKTAGVGAPKGVHGDLLKAAYAGDVGAVRSSLQVKANVNAKNSDDHTALMEAIDNDHIDVITVLIEAKADLNARDNEGGTALMLTCYGHAANVRQLVTAGADIHVEDKFRNTALSIASQKHQNPEIAAFLKAAGAKK